jgi:TolB protein
MNRPRSFEELVARARALTDRIDLAEPVQAVRRKVRRRRMIHRAQATALVVAILAATAGGAFALVRTTGIGRRERPGAGPGTANGRIAYASSVTGDNDIWVASADGATALNLTRDPGANDFGPAWSPDGARIAFSKWRGSDRGIFLMAADGTGLTRLSTGSDFGSAWSPDGSLIAFSRGHGIWVMEPNGDHARQITHSEGGDRDPTWSPDGRRIAFSRAKGSIVIVSAGGSDPVVVSDGGSDVQPAWSPDGARIAFERGQELFLMGTDGSAVRELTFGHHTVFSRAPAWSPDGTVLVYERAEGSTQTLAVIGADGSGARSLPLPGGQTFGMSPSWQPLASG